MQKRYEQSRLELIERLVDYLHKKMPEHDAPIVRPFVRQYYLSVSPEEMTNKNLDDLYGSVISHWNFIGTKKSEEDFKIRVFNPHIEKHGWQNKHTVIQIVVNDMPFLVDSIRMELNRLGINIYTILNISGMNFTRDKNTNEIVKVSIKHDTSDYKSTKDFDSDEKPQSEYLENVEIPIYIEIDRQSDDKKRDLIKKSLEKVLNDVKLVVSDWKPMKNEFLEKIQHFKSLSKKIKDTINFKDAINFADWVADEHFTYFGSQDYFINKKNQLLEADDNTAKGLYKKIKEEFACPIQTSNLLENDEVIHVAKTEFWSTVHRPAYIDMISMKIFDDKNKIIGEKRFIGLFTAEAYNDNPTTIPFINSKILGVLERSGFEKSSHSGKKMINIMINLPRDYLFQADEVELYQLSIGIFYIQERNQLKVFVRRDKTKRFFSCLVFVPRENFNSTIRDRFQRVLFNIFNAQDITFTTIFSESILIKVYFLIKVNPTEEIGYDVSVIEQKFKDISRTWTDDLNDALVESFGEEVTSDMNRIYSHAFPESYKENFSPSMAVLDIKHMENLNESKNLEMTLYRLIEEKNDSLRFKLYRQGELIPLSDIVPMLENLGIKVISERPYRIRRSGKEEVWINDYKMMHAKGGALDAEILKDIFQDAFYAVWEKRTENDELNKLVLNANLRWYEISVVRAYARFLWQVGLSFSRYYVAKTLNQHPKTSEKLIKFFCYKFDPKIKKTAEKMIFLENDMEMELEKINNLNEDRILRQFFYAMKATLRTNYFQKDENNKMKSYISLKFDSAKIPDIPLPIPMYEIFVYSPITEGVHLRAAKVSRGGLRWSDRHEDFRTEVLGLVKAQQVKNAVIIPSGAKGGFIVKKSLKSLSRDEMMEQVIECYQTFIKGLLDITDNRFKDKVIPPKNVVRYDDDDPYLVVAADKGTATFSDIANKISLDKGFWLGDAFASGGSTGYDHKKMGITARGAWESVKEHFYHLDHDTQTQPFTVVGIGDMGGDVFGNGMLLSNQIKLIAAYNHLHIFIDIDPDPAISFQERQRLFNLPRSSWNDYNQDLISKGGGVFWRSAKFIPISEEMKKRFNIKESKLNPNALIKAILTCEVDLIWNGGIGTFLKNSEEADSDVGDRENDGIRVKGKEVKARVIGEGGNLGLTQLARVELSKRNILVNTDAIDNSAGVNCSDHEVNIKVLLNEIVINGDMTIKQRNKLLSDMTDEVSELVLASNKAQAKAISIETLDSYKNLEMHVELIKELEKSAGLDRVIEYLPNDKEIANRKLNKTGLTRPEIAVIMAYSKNFLKRKLVDSKVPDEEWFYKFLVKYFPKPLREKYENYMPLHRLKREIICDYLSNLVVNEMGLSFIYRLSQETGSPIPDIIKAYMAAREIFGVEDFNHELDKYKNNIDSYVQFKIVLEFDRLIRRVTRWLLRNRRAGFKIDETVSYFKEGIFNIIENANGYIQKGNVSLFIEYEENLKQIGLSEHYQRYIKLIPALYSALDIIDASYTSNFDILVVCEMYFRVGHSLSFGWLRDTLKYCGISNKWQALARSAFRDDLDKQQRNIAISILMNCEGQQDSTTMEKIDIWINKYNELIFRWEQFIKEMRTTKNHEFAMFSVALRELLDLSQVSASCR